MYSLTVVMEIFGQVPLMLGDMPQFPLFPGSDSARDSEAWRKRWSWQGRTQAMQGLSGPWGVVTNPFNGDSYCGMDGHKHYEFATYPMFRPWNMRL